MKKILFSIFLSLFICSLSIAQGLEFHSDSTKNLGNNVFIRADFEYGYVLPSDGLPDDISQTIGGNFEIGLQGGGKNVYNSIMNYPAFGAGFLTYGFPESGKLGYPNALYLFLNAPFKRVNKWAFSLIIRLGMSYNWQPRDPINNPASLVLGSYRNLYISFGPEVQYLIGNSLTATAGFRFSHFSNGQSSLPNAGVNLITPHLGLKYDFNDGQPRDYEKYVKPEYTNKAMEYYFTFGTGIRQIFFDSIDTGVSESLGQSYHVRNISVAAQYQFGWSGKFGGGLDFIYWGAYNPQIMEGPGGIVQPVTYPFADYLQLGVFVSYEYVMKNFSIYAQPGWRVLRKEYDGMPTDFYQHLALKYHIHDLIVGIAIRAIKFGQAEYIEWNIGYRIRKSVKK